MYIFCQCHNGQRPIYHVKFNRSAGQLNAFVYVFLVNMQKIAIRMWNENTPKQQTKYLQGQLLLLWTNEYVFRCVSFWYWRICVNTDLQLKFYSETLFMPFNYISDITENGESLPRLSECIIPLYEWITTRRCVQVSQWNRAFERLLSAVRFLLVDLPKTTENKWFFYLMILS